MSRLRYNPTAGSRTRAPDDGIVITGRGAGWILERWVAMLDGFGDTHGGRLSQGRNIARNGRVRGLWLSPGVASAQVIAEEEYNVSLRFRVFTDAEWKLVLSRMLSDLRVLGAFLDGRLSQGLANALEAEGLSLLPTRDEVDGDCDCDDYMLPCAHMAAVHNVLAEALDGEPMLLFTLRGRPRPQWLAEIRRAWGDTRRGADLAMDEPAPSDSEADWFDGSTSLPPPDFRFKPAEQLGIGLRALGPPPGEVDLLGALGPLYEAGAAAALEMALSENDETERDENRVRAFKQQIQRPQAAEGHTSRPGLTEAVVNALAEVDCARSKDLAATLKADIIEVRDELLELEKLGIVYRTGKTRGTRWWLG